jgi:hypothetical protein
VPGDPVSVKEKFFLRGKASDRKFARATNAVLGKYRLGTAHEEQHKGMSVVRADQPTQGARKLRSVKTRARQLEWPDDCRHTRVSQLEGGRDFVDEPPINSKLFFYISHMR